MRKPGRIAEGGRMRHDLFRSSRFNGRPKERRARVRILQIRNATCAVCQCVGESTKSGSANNATLAGPSSAFELRWYHHCDTYPVSAVRKAR